MEDEILTNDEFNALVEQSAIEAIQEYNILYGTNHEADEEIILYLIAFAVISLYGYKALVGRTDIRKDIKTRVLSKFDKSYEGIKATTQKELEDMAKKLGRKPTAEEIRIFREKRTKAIVDGVFYATKNEVQAIQAGIDGLDYVGGITVGDSRVRDTHADHDRKYWRAGNYQPWTDYNCRCTYVYFKNGREARQAGFNPL